MLKKVVIIGPESTGKSTLCERLAQHYKTIWCREYARQYLTENGTGYKFDDLLTIAKGQINLEESVLRQAARFKSDAGKPCLPVFLDTDLMVMKVWCEYVFNDCHSWILNGISVRNYDLYLLCRPDLPWVSDQLREYPDERPRQELFHIYRDMLVHQHVPWVEIGGGHDQRVETAIRAVDAMSWTG